MKNFKYIFLIIVLCFSIFPLSGCYDSRGIENLGYAVALGIDEGTKDKIKLTFQFATLNSSDSSSSSSQSSSSTVVNIDCSTIDSGISLVNSYISKKINLSHCKSIVISETLATKGISEYIFSLANNVQLRPDCNIIISRCDAYHFLANSQPTLESISARYYELILTNSEYTGYTEDINFAEFYSSILSTSSQAVAILGGLNTSQTQIQSTNSLNGSYKADETPIESENNVENLGLAVFNGDKLVGELNNVETLCHLIISNELENATITIPNPYDISNSISVFIGLNKNTKNTVKIINGYPYITSKIFITGNILTLDDTIDLSSDKTLKMLEDYINTYLEENITSYLYKTSKEFKSDIDNFGKYVVCNYLTWDDWINSDWLNNYQNAFFDISVDSTIQSGYLFSTI